MALESPDLQDGERFAIAINWGVFEQSHGLGLSALGVVAEDVLGTGTRIAVQAGFGASVKQESYGGRSANSVYGGRAGFQASW
jgi:hypothetical protein